MIPGNANPLLLASAAEAAAAGDSNRSLRFEKGDSAYLDKTFSSAGNRKKWTFAAWIKRSLLGTTQRILRASEGTNSEAGIQFLSNDKIEIYHYVSGYTYQLNTTAVFRDPSSFFHIVVAVDTTQATAADRVTLYINGSEVTDFSTSTYPTQNFEGWVNDDVNHAIAGQDGLKFSGYMSHVFLIDGSALNATSFGSFDSNGVWQKADYSGTFGTNGFHLLDFANESTIGADSSGNNNDFTANNLSDTAGAGNDVLLDYPANGDTANDSGAGGQVNGNYCCWNPIAEYDPSPTFSNGNLEFTASSDWHIARGTIGVKTGKYYAEFTTVGATMLGIETEVADAGRSFYNGGSGTNGVIALRSNGTVHIDGVQQTSLGGWSDGNVIGMAVDLDGGSLVVTKDGSAYTTISIPSNSYWNDKNVFYSATALNNTDSVTANWGQRVFSNSAPSNHKCLCTTNLPTPTIADGSDYFNTLLWTGDGNTTRSLTGVGFNPDLVWFKSRDSGNDHNMIDAVRGANKTLIPNRNNAETTNPIHGYLTSFDSDGFSVTTGSFGVGDVNHLNREYVAWAWDAGTSTGSNTDGSVTSQVRVNQSAGISVVTFTNPSSGAFTVGHGLNAQVGLVFMKHRNRAGDWLTWFSGFSNSEYLVLNSTATKATASEVWGSSAPGSSTFGGKIGVSALAGDTDVAYCFAPVEGFSAMGTWSGNSSTADNQPFIYCGFRPRFILWKKYAGQTDNWFIFDTARDPYNRAENFLLPNSTLVETSDVYNKVDILSNGFKMRVDNAQFGSNTSHDFLFYAVAENPFQANGGLAR